MVLKGAHCEVLARKAGPFPCGNYEWSTVPIWGDIDALRKGGNTWNSTSEHKESLCLHQGPRLWALLLPPPTGALPLRSGGTRLPWLSPPSAPATQTTFTMVSDLRAGRKEWWNSCLQAHGMDIFWSYLKGLCLQNLISEIAFITIKLPHGTSSRPKTFDWKL